MGSKQSCNKNYRGQYSKDTKVLSLNTRKELIVDEYSKIIVYGYCKSQNENIPELIIHICLNYYYLQLKFDTECGKFSENLVFTNSNKTVSVKEFNWGTCYLNQEINDNICDVFEIEFIVNKVSHSEENHIFFGFVKDIDYKPCAALVENVNTDSIKISRNEAYFNSHNDPNNRICGIGKFISNDVCKIWINFKTQTCKFYIKNKCVKCITLNATRIIPAVSLIWTGMQMTIKNWKFEFIP